jgi:DNA-binding response OmpR family regulator
MKANILMIDDDKDMCEEVADILESRGYNIKAVFDGLEGMAILENAKFDILLLDMRLPGISGLDILKKIRGEKIKLKIIVLTGKPLVKISAQNDEMYEDDSREILKLADCVMHKPVDIEEVLKKVNEMIQL